MRLWSQLLEGLGFLQTESYWKHLIFTPRTTRPAHGLGEHSDNDMKSELPVVTAVWRAASDALRKARKFPLKRRSTADRFLRHRHCFRSHRPCHRKARG